jgi:hypothetical protein
MKSTILLLAVIVAALSSCTSAYKTGQTPDDVYYSPAPVTDEYVSTDKQEDRQYRNSDEYYDDRYLRMKVQNRYMWSDLDDWYYNGSRYQYTYYNYSPYNNPWTPYTYWNNHYNPYYGNCVMLNPSSAYYNHPRTFNLNTYNATQLTNNSYNSHYYPGTGVNSNNANGPRTNSTNTNTSNTGNVLRNFFRGNNNSNNTSTNNSTNTNSSSSSGSSSSSSGSSSAPVRRF